MISVSEITAGIPERLKKPEDCPTRVKGQRSQIDGIRDIEHRGMAKDEVNR
jgi:hypothetical protein